MGESNRYSISPLRANVRTSMYFLSRPMEISGKSGKTIVCSRRLIKDEREALTFYVGRRFHRVIGGRYGRYKGMGKRLQKFIYNVQLNRVCTIRLGEHLIVRRWSWATYLAPGPFPIVRPARGLVH